MDETNYDEKRHGHFKWLRREERGVTYNSFARFAHLPACSFDWGGDGYAGSSNYGGELLYLSAKSPKRGLIMARGDFSTSLYTSLSRTQVEFGGPTTFGFEVTRAERPYDPENASRDNDTAKKRSSFELGPMIERGCFNYRWPFNEYYLDIHHELGTKKKQPGQMESQEGIQEEKHVGTCQMFSFTMDRKFYQVLRIEEGFNSDEESDSWRPFPAKCQVVLTMGGPLWLSSFVQDKTMHQIDIETSTVEDISEFPTIKGTTMIRLWDPKRGIGLEARAYQLYQEKEPKELYMTKSTAAADSGPPPAQKTKIKAYNAVGEFKDLDNDDPTPRSAVFMVVIRFFEGNMADPMDREFVLPLSEKWDPLPSSKDIYEHIGVDPTSTDATGAMWDSIVIQKRSQSAPILDLSDVSLIGRSLEKVLQVDSVPATFNSTQHPQEAESFEETALVSNLFMGADIDLKALFWKVRFLVRTYKFLSRFCETSTESGQHGQETDKPNTDDNKPALSDKVLHLSSPQDLPKIEVGRMQEIVDAQLDRIQRNVESVLRYLVKTLLSSDSSTPLMPDSKPSGHLGYFYVLTTIWYVKRNFPKKYHPKWNWDWEMSLGKSKQDYPIFDHGRLPSENWTFEALEREQVPFLQWYHYGSMLALHQQVIVSWKDSGLEEKVSMLAKGAKIFAAGKLSSRKPYCTDDEIIDRLSFLSDELGLQPRKTGEIGTIAATAIKRVKQRENTRYLNPGWLSPGQKGTTSGPWEIHALCHHSRLMALILEEKDTQDRRAKEHTKEEIESYKQRIYSFRNAEGTLVSCWERAHVKAREGWLRSEATAVLASTLLNINRKYLKNGLRNISTEHVPKTTPETEQAQAAKSQNTQDLTKHVDLDQGNLLLEMKYIESIMKDQLDIFERFTGESGRVPPINWVAFSPPRRYHPDSFFDSLEDTPEKYAVDRLESTSVPTSIISKITAPKDLKLGTELGVGHEAGFDWDYLCNHLENLNIFDIPAIQSNEKVNGFNREIKPYEYNRGEPEFLEDRENDPCWRLYDSLVDLEVQHRFLVVKEPELKKQFLNLLVYVIHPESAICLGNHILKFSRFSCDKGDAWVANITLRTWQVKKREKLLDDAQAQTFKDDEPIRLPKTLEKLWKNDPKKAAEKLALQTLSFELDVSSIVLSTNEFGDFSKCTVWSALLGNPEMVGIVEEAQKLWQKFVHQPQTGRCLVFFLLLSKLCEIIAKSYDLAIEKLTHILELNNNFNRSDDQWATDKNGPIAFELGLWSLDSLHKLEYSLNATIGSLVNAKEDLMAQIQNGPGTRSKKLESMCQEYVGIFESSLVQLTSINATLERRINLNTRHEESFSAVQSMRDSRTSISQNATVQRLTYLTIAYLPIGLMAAIFAIPSDQKVLYANMGRRWFVGGILIMSAATYAFAFYIGRLLAQIANISELTSYKSQKLLPGRPASLSNHSGDGSCEESVEGPASESTEPRNGMRKQSPTDPQRMEEGRGGL